MIFKFFTRDFLVKKIISKKFLKWFLLKLKLRENFSKDFPWKFTPALVLHMLYFPLKLSLIPAIDLVDSEGTSKANHILSIGLKERWANIWIPKFLKLILVGTIVDDTCSHTIRSWPQILQRPIFYKNFDDTNTFEAKENPY